MIIILKDTETFPKTCKPHNSHCVKNVRIRSFPGPYFPTFGLNTEIIIIIIIHLFTVDNKFTRQYS